MNPTFNWRELNYFLEQIRSKIEGLLVERLFVPARPFFPEKFLKGEFAFALKARAKSYTLVFNIRAQKPYLALYAHKGPKALASATRSPFDLALAKHLSGLQLVEAKALEKERIALFWFTGKEHLGLVLVLIPSRPEALLVIKRENDSKLKVLARTRSSPEPFFTLPDGSQAPKDLPLREELFCGGGVNFSTLLEKSLEQEAFDLRRKKLEQHLSDPLKQTQDRSRQAQTALDQARNEPDWQKQGDLLKSSLHEPHTIVDGKRLILDFETGEKIKIPCDPSLSPPKQLEKFYQQARRKKKREEEASTRLLELRNKEDALKTSLARLPRELNWKSLEELEKEIQPGSKGPQKIQDKSGWHGKKFLSKDGFSIWVGRDKEENQQLTFKLARGNDLWFHVRGRPGAHAIVQVPPGKSVPLETLLDAARLAIYYSGGKTWGKTEVDYTFRKYVKKIPKSIEVTYNQNKTLIVAPDPERLQRLLSSGD